MINLLNNLYRIHYNVESTINYGGCGYFAYLLSKHLDNLDVEHSIVCFDSRTRKPVNDSVVSKMNPYNVYGIGHVAVETGGLYYDSRGQVIFSKDMNKTGYISIKTLEKLLNMDIWNTAFNSRQAFTIEAALKKLIESIFSRIYNEGY